MTVLFSYIVTPYALAVVCVPHSKILWYSTGVVLALLNQKETLLLLLPVGNVGIFPETKAS